MRLNVDLLNNNHNNYHQHDYDICHDSPLVGDGAKIGPKCGGNFEQTDQCDGGGQQRGSSSSSCRKEPISSSSKVCEHKQQQQQQQQQRRRSHRLKRGPLKILPKFSLWHHFPKMCLTILVIFTTSWPQSPNNNGPVQSRAPSILFVWANSDANRLYEDLMMTYNRIVRPVQNNSDRVVVRLGLKLSQLMDVVSRGSDLCLLVPCCLVLLTRFLHSRVPFCILWPKLKRRAPTKQASPLLHCASFRQMQFEAGFTLSIRAALAHNWISVWLLLCCISAADLAPHTNNES